MEKGAEQDERRNELLYGLYESCASPLSERERESITPILNSLKRSKGRYERPELLSEGGEKRILRVYDRLLNRFVAMAKPRNARNPDEQERFLREGQLTANLTHPNIVPVHNMGIDADGEPFFSMELLPEGGLRDILQKGGAAGKKRRLGQLLDIFLKVCDAVAYAHSRNVLHLDIKPDNIRVGRFGEVFLCDWGLARVGSFSEEGEPKPGELDGDLLNDATLTGTLKGTPGFMAPEQIDNRQKTVQSDIYALGAILYLILTGKLPVEGRDASEILENTRQGNIVPPRKRCPSCAIPSALAAVAMKALSPDPSERYPSVQELRDDVKRFLESQPTRAENPGVFARLILLSQRHREATLWVLLSLSLLAVVMSIALAVIQREKQVAERNLALYRRERETSQAMDRKLNLLSTYSQNLSGYVDAGSMVSMIDEIIGQDISPETVQRLLLKKAWLHVVLEQFSEAAQAFEKVSNLDESSRRLFALCREYERVKPDDRQPLSGKELARLLTRRDAVKRNLAFFIYYHHFRRWPEMAPEEYIRVAGAILVRLNEMNEDTIPELRLVRRPEGYHLDLSHTPYSKYVVEEPLVYRLNVLAPLHLYSLDISHTPVSLVRELTDMKLTELRMVGTTIYPAAGLGWSTKALGLRRLVVGKGEYPEKVIRELRERNGIEVIEVEEDSPTPSQGEAAGSPGQPAS